jgi:hypothetical protein
MEESGLEGGNGIHTLLFSVSALTNIIKMVVLIIGFLFFLFFLFCVCGWGGDDFADGMFLWSASPRH